MASAAPVSEGGETAGAFIDPGVWNLLDDGPGDQSLLLPEAPAVVDDLRLSEASDPPFSWDDPYGSAEEVTTSLVIFTLFPILQQSLFDQKRLSIKPSGMYLGRTDVFYK